MTTVKEFRDLGVEFVTDDKVQWRHGNMAGVISFAWRPLNTLPDNPRFKYEVATDNHSWRPLLDQSGLKAGEPTKPVFTQAMADAGEFPPVGSKFLYSYVANPKEKDWHEVESKYVDGDCMFFKGSGGVRGFMNIGDMFCSPCKPLDTRTPKQKAVDEIVKMLHSEGVVAFDPIMLHIMYEKGFIKQ